MLEWLKWRWSFVKKPIGANTVGRTLVHCPTVHPIYIHANFLMYSLFKLVVIDNCPNFAIAVGSPIRSGNFNTRFAGVDPESKSKKMANLSNSIRPSRPRFKVALGPTAQQALASNFL